jgi:hypothetical protein
MPRLRHLEDVEEYLQELNIKKWQQKALDRQEWASVIKVANALTDP